MHYYIHIPFCVSRCGYCDFFSTTLLHRRQEYVTALISEIQLRQSSAPSTIYFGGGTPSTLHLTDIKRILDTVSPIEYRQSAEITLEANPGDLTSDKLRQLKRMWINRLSIGIQSFNNRLLQLIGRRHNAQEAINAVHKAQEAGFDNISIDLIYGLPNQDIASWKKDIDTALSLNIQHLSCYCLSYEQGTKITQLLERGELQEQDEETLNYMYDYLCDTMKNNGFVHYEVSNFALPDRYSRHNSSYWTDESYIGLGAGAHSYDAEKRIRSWNVSDLNEYISCICRGRRPSEEENITDEQHRMEQIMLGLRTCHGVSKGLIPESPQLADYLSRRFLRDTGTHYIVTSTGLHLLNRIIQDLT
ncbi:MAG: radical SAM family heme chaperone HemW [Paludibacteraceae bacterium]|nr:radical SAM family heme chaperone HemW [Paludibacteraceae bacterium]